MSNMDSSKVNSFEEQFLTATGKPSNLGGQN